ncbi:SsrA-binding protein, partial [Streptococcus suis]
MAKGEGNVLAQNKKARHDYTIVDTVEAGMVLTGPEITSIRAGRIHLTEGFAQLQRG